MAGRHPELGWYFVYTREAHPGEHWPHHESFDQKLAAAKKARDELPLRRPVLVDGIDGPIHTAYGLMPNMTWVLGRGGQILYKSMWTSAARVEEYVERMSGQDPTRMSPFYTEQVEFRERDQEMFDRRLEMNGPRAVTEWKRAVEIWTARARAEAKKRRGKA